MILFDISPLPSDSPIAIAVAIGFFLVLLAVAFIAYRLLKRTLKMAFRMAIVAIILLVAFVGSIALFYGVGSSTNTKTRPRPTVNSSR